MKAYGAFPKHLDDYPDKADLNVLGRNNRKASDRRSARRFWNKVTRRTVKHAISHAIAESGVTG